MFTSWTPCLPLENGRQAERRRNRSLGGLACAGADARQAVGRVQGGIGPGFHGRTVPWRSRRPASGAISGALSGSEALAPGSLRRAWVRRPCLVGLPVALGPAPFAASRG